MKVGYEFVDWMSCRFCSNTNTLFKLRVDAYYKKTTSKIRLKVTRICKNCYLENCLIKNAHQWETRRKEILESQKQYRIRNKKAYNKRARGYYQKRRPAALEQKRAKYIAKKKKDTLLNRVKFRDSLLLYKR